MTTWYKVPGCVDIHASDDGQILNAQKGRIKRQRRANNGAMQVDIGGRTRMVHDLVARAVYGEPPGPGYRPVHRDGNRANNCAENLMWASSAVAEGKPSRPPTHSIQLEHEYEKARLDRLALIELMQS